MQTSEISGNTAYGKGSAGMGLGGAVYIAETCTGATCTSASAIISDTALTNNVAHQVQPDLRRVTRHRC